MSAGSGIVPNAASLALVEELRKNNSKYFFALFKVQGTEVVPDSTYPSNDNEFKDFLGEKKNEENYAKTFKTKYWPLFTKSIEQADGPRFAVLDFAYVTKEGRVIRNLVSIGWCADKGTSARVKMTFASTKTSFEAKINVGKKYQANDYSDLEHDTVLEKIAQQ